MPLVASYNCCWNGALAASASSCFLNSAAFISAGTYLSPHVALLRISGLIANINGGIVCAQDAPLSTHVPLSSGGCDLKSLPAIVTDGVGIGPFPPR